MPNTLPPNTPLKNNSYRILRLLGQGGFGPVYLADDLIMNQPCAIKGSFDNSPGAQAQFEVEARILANLKHDHLPRVTDNFIESATGLQYLVMEYVEGQDLGELLEQSGLLPQSKVLAWLDQVLDAVAYLHAYQPRPVIHRDIKPDNIRLLPDGKTVKLVDFGIAKIGGGSAKTRAAARGYTPGFSPPEQHGTGTDTYSDVYALGATLYNLLTKVVPPDAIDRSYSGAQLDPPRKFNPQISPEVEQVILTALQIEPKLRFPTAGEMRLALQGKRSTTVSVGCPHCSAPVRATAKFCPTCGQTIIRVAPFVFQKSGYQARNISELVRGCDTYWQEALANFRQGEFDSWLNQLGANGQKLAAQGRTLRAKHSDPSAALEAFLQAASSTRSLPILTVKPMTLDFGSLRAGDSKVLTIAISNSGRGYLHGTVQAQPAWLRPHPVSFGCLAGENQKIEVEIQTVNLSGTELGVDYNGAVTVLSSRGQQTIPIRLKVVDEPMAQLDPPQLDVGQVTWGSRSRRQVTVLNAGGGTLHGTLVSGEPWLVVNPAGQTFALSKGQSLPVTFTIDAGQFPRRGRYSGQLHVQTKGRGHPATVVAIGVDVPFPLDPAQPDTAISTVTDLIAYCDARWEWGLHFLNTGRIEAFLQFIDQADLVQVAATARQHPDSNVGLEQLLRAAGAAVPAKYDTNAMDVVGELGFGPLPKLFGRPETVTLQILNKSQRGYLHGQVESLVDWLQLSQPRFGCLPGEVTEVKIQVVKT